MIRKLVVAIDSNRVTCGDCYHLRKRPSSVNPKGDWWCQMFGISRGYVGAMKTPNRANMCTAAEAEANKS